MQAHIRRRAQNADITLIDQHAGNFESNLSRCLKTGALPVVVGGDGSISRMCTALLALAPKDHPPRMGIIPLGSGNDAARTLNLPLSIDKGLTALLGASNHRPIDLLELTQNGDTLGHGLTLATFGFPTNVIHATAKLGRLGALKYAIGTILALLKSATPPPTVTFDDCDIQINSGVPRLVGLANGAYTGGGMKMVPSADISDARADAVVLQPTGPARLLWLLANVFVGTHIHDPKVSIRPCNQMRATIAEPATMVLDGELFTVSGDVSVSLRPAAIYLVG